LYGGAVGKCLFFLKRKPKKRRRARILLLQLLVLSDSAINKGLTAMTMVEKIAIDR
jgi:hypothetical protein